MKKKSWKIHAVLFSELSSNKVVKTIVSGVLLPIFSSIFLIAVPTLTKTAPHRRTLRFLAPKFFHWSLYLDSWSKLPFLHYFNEEAHSTDREIKIAGIVYGNFRIFAAFE